MRYLYALSLATVGYALFVTLPPVVSAAPFMLAFTATGLVLARADRSAARRAAR